MAFDTVEPITQVPTRVETLVVILQYSYDGAELVKSAKYEIEVSDQDGATAEQWQRTGHLTPHLTAEELATQVAFMNAQWARAQAVIPE